MRLRLSNGRDWAHEFTSDTPEQLKLESRRAFAVYIAQKSAQYFAFRKWLIETTRELDEWRANHPKTAANEGQYRSWVYNAQRGIRYGKQVIEPVADPFDLWLQLHVENPVISSEWVNPTPEVSNAPGGSSVCPLINRDLNIKSQPKYQSFDALYQRCKQMEIHARNLSMLGKWVAENDDATCKKTNLKIVEVPNVQNIPEKND